MVPRKFFALLITLFILVAGLTGCGHKGPPKPPTTPAEEAKG